MDCPKCNAPMEEATYGRNMTIDRCTGCQGIWFDLGEAEQLKDKWMSEFLDTGNAKAGKTNNAITDCACPPKGGLPFFKHSTLLLFEIENNWAEGLQL